MDNTKLLFPAQNTSNEQGLTVSLATVNVIDIKNKKEFTLRIGLIICPIYGVNSLVNTTGM